MKWLITFLLFLGVFPFVLCAEKDIYKEALIVSYATAHLNEIEEAVEGVLVTPDGNILTTEVIGPYGIKKIVIDSPVSGSYLAYFRAVTIIPPRLCYIVGGIDAHLSAQPSKIVEFIPKESHIQGFNTKLPIIVGTTTLPIANFSIN